MGELFVLVGVAAGAAAIAMIRAHRKHIGRKTHPRSLMQKKAEVADFLRLDALVRQKDSFKDPLLDRSVICSRLGIERHALNQLMKDYAGGLSIPAYINRVRMEQACILLKESPDKSLADIASDVGMSPQNFRIQFKNIFGLTPTEYRQAGEA